MGAEQQTSHAINFQVEDHIVLVFAFANDG
jgi:hypothetical protein